MVSLIHFIIFYLKMSQEYTNIYEKFNVIPFDACEAIKNLLKENERRSSLQSEICRLLMEIEHKRTWELKLNCIKARKFPSDVVSQIAVDSIKTDQELNQYIKMLELYSATLCEENNCNHRKIMRFESRCFTCYSVSICNVVESDRNWSRYTLELKLSDSINNRPLPIELLEMLIKCMMNLSSAEITADRNGKLCISVNTCRYLKGPFGTAVNRMLDRSIIPNITASDANAIIDRLKIGSSLYTVKEHLGGVCLVVFENETGWLFPEDPCVLFMQAVKIRNHPLTLIMTDAVYTKIITEIQTKVQFHTLLLDGNHEVVFFENFARNIPQIKLQVELYTLELSCEQLRKLLSATGQ
jgi:hypothetical protein